LPRNIAKQKSHDPAINQPNLADDYVLVLPNGTRYEPIKNDPNALMNANKNSSLGMEFPNTDIYFINPLITVDTVRHAGKHYLLSRILRQIDDFAFNGAKIKPIPPEDKAKDIPEDDIDEVQSKIDRIDSKVVKTILRMRQATYDEFIYGSAVFERIEGIIEDWIAPVIFKRLPAYSFCERPIGRMDIQRYVTGDILYGIVFDKQTNTFEYWQKQNQISVPIQIPTKNVIHLKDEISEQVDGDSFVQKVMPLIRKLDYADMALMETVHRAGAPLLWIKIEEYRDNPAAQGQGLWSPATAFEMGKKIAVNHGKNNAMVAPSCITPVPLDYKLCIDPMQVITSYEERVLKALVPRDFLESQNGGSGGLGKSNAAGLELLMMIAEGWRERVAKTFIEMWNTILEENGYEGWKVEVEWKELDPTDESELFKRAAIAFGMTNLFTEDEIREIAGKPPMSEEDKTAKEEKDASDAQAKQDQFNATLASKAGVPPGQPGQVPPGLAQKKGAVPPGKNPVGTQVKPVDVTITKDVKGKGGKNVKTDKGEVVKDKQEKPLKNSLVENFITNASDKKTPAELEKLMAEKAHLFATWAKEAGFMPWDENE
jgi:hypothetical protein